MSKIKRKVERLSIILLIVFGGASCYAKQRGGSMDLITNTKNWKTYCVGRYLIDFPDFPGTELQENSQFSGDKIIWEKNLKNRADILKITNQMEKNLKANLELDGKPQVLARRDGKSYFIKKIDYPNGGVGILIYANHTNNPTAYKLYNYFITEKPFRVFSTEVKGIFDNNLELVLQRAQQMAANLRSRELNEIPKGSGLCFDGGFLAGTQDQQAELLSIRMFYPYFSEKYKFEIGMGIGVVAVPNKTHPKKDSFQPILGAGKTLTDKSNIIVADMAGMEYGYINKSDPPHPFSEYDFMWKFPGTSYSSEQAAVSIYMGSTKRDYRKNKPMSLYLTLANDDQALSLWNKVKASVRRRPE